MAYSRVVQAFVDVWGSLTGLFAENQFENVDWSTFQNFSQANADLHDRGPNAVRGLHKRFRYCTTAEVLANGNEGDALENLDFDTCCVGTQIVVQYYQPDPLVAATRDQLLLAAYDPSPDAKFIYSDGSFRTGDRIAPAKFVPAASAQGQYGYVRRDTVPPSISNWREGELSIWELNSVDEFATAKQAGGPWPPFTGVDDAYWKPASPPTTVATGSSQFLPGTYTIQPTDLPEPKITVPNALAFSPQVGIAGTNGSLNQLAYGNGFTIAGNVLTVLAAASVQAGEVVHYSYLPGTVQAPASAAPPRHVLVTNPNSRFNDLNLSGQYEFTGGLFNNVSAVAGQLLKGGATALSNARTGMLSDVLAALNADIAGLTLSERLYYTIRFQTTATLQANVAQLTLDSTLSGVEFEAVPPHSTPFLPYSANGGVPPQGYTGPVPGESFEENDPRWVVEVLTAGGGPGFDSSWSQGRVQIRNSGAGDAVYGIEFFANGVLNVYLGDTVATSYKLQLYQQDRTTLLGEYTVSTTTGQFGGVNSIAMTISGLPPQIYYMRCVNTVNGFMCLDKFQLV